MTSPRGPLKCRDSFSLPGSGGDARFSRNRLGSIVGDRRHRVGEASRLSTDQHHLRVLIANEKRERLDLLAQVVAGLGHEVIAREIYVKEVGAATERERPDVALVGLGLSSEHALELITEIVREASCPVIALLSAKDPAYVREAAKRGVFAYIVDGDAQELQSAIDITLQRFAEYQSLQGAFGRRALIEQAKGILMARHSVDAGHAFDMLRDHSQHNGRKVVEVAQAVVDSHLLLLPPPTDPAATEPAR
jgi:AmiR/NasT family two-component response regulator